MADHNNNNIYFFILIPNILLFIKIYLVHIRDNIEDAGLRELPVLICIKFCSLTSIFPTFSGC